MNKDDMGDGIPTDQLSHNHATVLTTTATVTLSLRACLCFLLSHLQSQVHRRQKQLSDFIEPKKYLRATLETWWISQDSHVLEEPEEQGKKSRAGRGSVCNLARQSQ